MDASGEMAIVQRLAFAGDEDEDTRLWRCVQGGDDAAFEALVQRHGAKLASVASRLLPNRADVEDVVQETFVRAFECRRRYPRVRCLRTWLLRIMVNLCHSRRRTAWWRRILLTHDYRGVDPLGADVQELAERRVVDQALHAALAGLPEALRVPFLLRYAEELSGAEIAAVLGCKESTVWSRIYTARRRLRQSLGETRAAPTDEFDEVP